jgi:hypothetical protein
LTCHLIIVSFIFKAASEGYIAIIMPRGGDWKKVSSSLLTAKEYEEKRPSQKVQDDVMGD